MFRSDPGASLATPPVGPSPQSIVTAAVESPSGEEHRCRAEEVAIAVEVSGRTRRTALVVAAGLLCGWWVTALTPFSAGATVAVLAFGAAEIAAAEVLRRRRHPHRPSGAGRRPVLQGLAYLPWLLAIAGLAAWELFELFSLPRSAHPTISSMVDPLLAHHALRWLAFAAWAWLGWELAR